MYFRFGRYTNRAFSTSQPHTPVTKMRKLLTHPSSSYILGVVEVLTQAVLHVFCWQIALLYEMPKSEKGDHSAKYSRSEFCQKLIRQSTPWTQSVCRINLILAHAVLQIFCWQCSIGLQCISRKRGIIQPNIHKILRKVNQVICIMYPNSTPDIMILTQAVLQIFCWQYCFTIQNAKVGKGREFSQIFTEFCQKLIRSCTPWTQSLNQYIMILSQAVRHVFCWQCSVCLQLQSKTHRKGGVTLQHQVQRKRKKIWVRLFFRVCLNIVK